MSQKAIITLTDCEDGTLDATLEFEPEIVIDECDSKAAHAAVSMMSHLTSLAKTHEVLSDDE